MKIEILDGDEVIKTFSSTEKSPFKSLELKKGMNVRRWALMTEPIKASKGVLSAQQSGLMSGYHVAPGTYTVRLTHKEFTQSQQITVVKDPRDEASEEEIIAKTEILKGIYQELVELYQIVTDMQQVRVQIKTMNERMSNDDEIMETGDLINKSITEVEAELISPKQETFQDIINYRNQLDQHLHYLMQTIDSNDPPLTEGEKTLLKELTDKLSVVKGKANKVMTEEVAGYNNLLKEKGVQYIAPKSSEEKPDNSM